MLNKEVFDEDLMHLKAIHLRHLNLQYKKGKKSRSINKAETIWKPIKTMCIPNTPTFL